LIRVYIISPAIAVRVGLRSLLMDDPRIQITGEAADPNEFEDNGGEVDVVIWSPALRLNRDMLLTGLASMKIGVAAALLLIHDDPNVIEKLIKLKVHAWGMLPPESSQAELISAVEAVNEGLVVTNPLWFQHLSWRQKPSNGENPDMVESLTGREIEILQLLALGLTNKQIAVRLKISTHTVKFHVSSIFGKFGTTNRTETVKIGLKTGLISL
jgi:two-component system, NarL family, response regulator YdfI